MEVVGLVTFETLVSHVKLAKTLLKYSWNVPGISH